MNQLFNRIISITSIDGKTLVERALKTSEEAGEIAGATLSYVGAPGTSYKNLGQNDVIEESVDTLICALSMIAHIAPNMTIEEIEFIANTKMDKWEQKVREEKIKRNDK
jgi:NTP pyrophosphatase (non-canonical NTP hydrolase)